MTATATSTLSTDQAAAHDAVLAWFKAKPKQILTLGGYAGSGKTTLMGAVANTLRKERPGLSIGFICFTGKASTVLKAKLTRAGALRGDYCGTIHGLIYEPKKDLLGRVVGWTRKGHLNEQLLILDEASMVDEQTLKDLSAFGKPILAVGDHGQLPPVTGTLNLMAAPELRLEKIHRQAADNPIVRASMLVRETGRLPACHWEGPSGSVVKANDPDLLARVPNAELCEAMVICGTNRKRAELNAQIRARLGYAGPEPRVGEKLICLRNNRKLGLFNGLTGTLQEIKPGGPDHYQTTVLMDGAPAPTRVLMNRRQFGAAATLQYGEAHAGDLFDFGYAITCHKSQGSEAEKVVVFEDCAWLATEDLRRRWKYTAYTRAAKHLLVVGR